MIVKKSNNQAETRKIGEFLARRILKSVPKKSARVLGLMGDLGAGKTTFLQGFAEGLGVKEKILSPTFIIVRRSKIKNSKLKIKNFYHIDCYRIKKPKDILSLGFRDIISDPKNIVAIEWAERIVPLLPKSAILVQLKPVAKNKREIKIAL